MKRDPMDFRPDNRSERVFAERYEREKAEYVRTHPQATPREYEAAVRAIAERLWV